MEKLLAASAARHFKLFRMTELVLDIPDQARGGTSASE
jgi:hypothetical protein